MKSFFVTAGFVILLNTSFAQKKLTAVNTSKGTAVEHKVVSGESLGSLSIRYDVTLSSLARANGMKTSDQLKIGQVVNVPLGSNFNSTGKGIPVYYTVAARDNLTTISKRFGKTDVKKLKSLNKLKDDKAPKGKELLVGYLAVNGPVAKVETPVAKASSDNPGTAKAEGQKMRIATETSINIRKGPGTNYPVIGRAQSGDVVTVIKKANNEWVTIRVDDGTEGYLASQYLEPVTVKARALTETYVNVRKGPGTDQPVVASIRKDEEVTVVREVNKEWSAIRTAEGKDGFVASKFLAVGGDSAPEQGVAKAPAPVKETPAPKEKELQKVRALTDTYINIRKGPGTDQPVVGRAEKDELVAVVRKVNNEWVAVRTGDGVEGYAAALYLDMEGTGRNTAHTTPPVVKEEEEQPPVVSSAPVSAGIPPAASYDERGYFKTDYDKQLANGKEQNQVLKSGLFKTDKGWADGKYYALVDGIPSGTIVKLSSPNSNRYVYAKVLGDIKSLKQSSGPALRVSEAAATALRINDNSFNLVVSH